MGIDFYLTILLLLPIQKKGCLLKNMAKVIETVDLTRRFGELVAVDKLNISVDHNEIFGLL